MVALLAALIELLASLIGDETAAHLVTQAGTPHPAGQPRSDMLQTEASQAGL